MGWGTFIAGQAIRNIRRAGRKPVPGWWEILDQHNASQPTEAELAELKRQKVELRQLKKLAREQRSQEKTAVRKVKSERFRRDMQEARAQGAEQRDSLIYKILRVVIIVLAFLFIASLIIVGLN